MAAPSLQDGIERAGSPVALLWKPGAAPWLPEVIEPEYAGWRREQAAWHDGVSISDVSHHMFDTVITGPDGSFFSADIEDYYCSPWELGYGRSISFNHDFIGRDALEKAEDSVLRTKVTLVFDPEDVREVTGDPGFQLTYARHRVEAGSALAGLTYQTATIEPAGTILSLTLIDKQFAEPGTEVTVVWGEHPGPGTPADADLGFPRIRATVAPAPFGEHARTRYRRHLW